MTLGDGEMAGNGHPEPQAYLLGVTSVSQGGAKQNIGCQTGAFKSLSGKGLASLACDRGAS